MHWVSWILSSRSLGDMAEIPVLGFCMMSHCHSQGPLEASVRDTTQACSSTKGVYWLTELQSLGTDDCRCCMSTEVPFLISCFCFPLGWLPSQMGSPNALRSSGLATTMKKVPHSPSRFRKIGGLMLMGWVRSQPQRS